MAKRRVAVVLTLFSAFIAGVILGVGLFFHYVPMPRESQTIRDVERLLRTSDALIELGTYDSLTPISALRELRAGNSECAICTLESHLRSNIAELELLETDATEGVSELAQEELQEIQVHFSAHPPLSRSKCDEACR